MEINCRKIEKALKVSWIVVNVFLCGQLNSNAGEKKEYKDVLFNIIYASEHIG